MLKKLRIASAAIFISVVGATSVSAAPVNFCNNYASIAVWQFNEARSQGLTGLLFPWWSDYWQGHYEWCLSTTVAAADQQTAMRGRRLGN